MTIFLEKVLTKYNNAIQLAPWMKKPIEESALWAEGKQTKATKRADKKLAAFAESAQEGKSYTLQEIATVMGVSRERVRQIEARALRRLHRRLGQIFRNEGISPEEAMSMVRNASTESGVPETDMPAS